MTKKEIKVTAFPLDTSLEGEYKISDHLNLCGQAIKDLGFIPISDLYVDKNNPEAIKIACLKEGVEPNEEEKETLIKHGVKAYSYELIEPALRAAANSETVEAVASIPKLPKAFSLEARSCGLKDSQRLDFGLIISELPCLWAGTFTQNKAKAFCVEENIKKLNQKVKVLACNSGNANACTGKAGEKADLETRTKIAENFSIFPNEVLFASTGKIGVNLPSEKLCSSLKKKADDSIEAFAQSILTTDTCTKISQNKNFLGFAKGSGMIHPQMATMLAFIISDKKVSSLEETERKNFMQDCLSQAVEKSFNSITVDGDSSTNDMCILMSNESAEEVSKEEFQKDLEQVCEELAYKIVADGEGLTKLSKLEIQSNLTDKEARELGRFILNSALVKTALHGNDPNWGRIIASLGQYAGDKNLDLDLEAAELKILDTLVFKNGINTDFDREELIKEMKKCFELPISLKLSSKAKSSVTLYGNDLSHDYIKINAEYFT